MILGVFSGHLVVVSVQLLANCGNNLQADFAT